MPDFRNSLQHIYTKIVIVNYLNNLISKRGTIKKTCEFGQWDHYTECTYNSISPLPYLFFIFFTMVFEIKQVIRISL